MSNTISVSDEIFELSGKLAKKLKVSRSKILSMSIEKMAKESKDKEIIAKLNEFYKNERAEIDPVITKMAALSLPDDEW